MNHAINGRSPGVLPIEIDQAHEIMSMLEQAFDRCGGTLDAIDTAINPIDGGPLPMMDAAISGTAEQPDGPLRPIPSGLAGEIASLTGRIESMIARTGRFQSTANEIIARLERIA